VRDVSFHEDRCRVRTGPGPEVFAATRNAAMRNAAMTIPSRLGHVNIAACLRHFLMDFKQASSLVRHGRIE
jgi:hypothetical protein